MHIFLQVILMLVWKGVTGVNMYKASALRTGSGWSDISSWKGHNPFEICVWSPAFCINDVASIGVEKMA
jgi:hypothetical protein